MINKKVFLIVDDTEINRKVLKGFWKNDSGVEILEADSAKAALEILQKRNDVSLILMDVVMPEMSGFELLAELKKSDRFSHIPVIINTQSDGHNLEERSLQLGADDFFPKPYVEEIVKRRIDNVLKKSAYDKQRLDSLTGIYNFDTFCSLTKQMMEMDMVSDFAILRFNIVRFKLINELLGRKTGDEILILLARLIKRAVGIEGTYGRLEADNFVCCMPLGKIKENTKFNNIMVTGAKELERQYSLTIQSGIYLVRDRSLPISMMCDRAGTACRNIRDNMVKQFSYYNDEEAEKELEELMLIREMVKAVKGGQFHIVLQPIFDVKTEQAVSAEALVRWKHPEKGVISPGIFVPLFEKSGLISKLDMFVCEEACRVLAKLKKDGVPICPISVNISRVDFCEPDLVKRINEMTEKYGLDKKYIKIEVTESAYTQNPQEIIQQVIDFRSQGYEVLMDDFGSGYSSLNTLRELPANILKIDMKFMNQLENSGRAASILLCIVKMSKMLGMKTVAEGVENQSQVDFLRNIGCDSIQGYFFSPPIKPMEFRNLLARQKDSNGDNGKTDKIGVLLVDDMKLARITMKDALGDEYKYFEAADGVQALEVLQKNAHESDLIITDVVMPNMDGIALLRKIKSTPAFMEMPVVVVTANDDSSDELHALEQGAIELIHKPFDFRVVRQRIKNVLELAENEWLKKEIWDMKQREALRQMKENQKVLF